MKRAWLAIPTAVAVGMLAFIVWRAQPAPARPANSTSPERPNPETEGIVNEFLRAINAEASDPSTFRWLRSSKILESKRKGWEVGAGDLALVVDDETKRVVNLWSPKYEEWNLRGGGSKPRISLEDCAKRIASVAESVQIPKELTRSKLAIEYFGGAPGGGGEGCGVAYLSPSGEPVAAIAIDRSNGQVYRYFFAPWKLASTTP